MLQVLELLGQELEHLGAQDHLHLGRALDTMHGKAALLPSRPFTPFYPQLF